MLLDERNKIHAAIEEACERADLKVETGGGWLKRIGDVVDDGDMWEVSVVVKISKRRVQGES
jgi:hypothetical protein